LVKSDWEIGSSTPSPPRPLFTAGSLLWVGLNDSSTSDGDVDNVDDDDDDDVDGDVFDDDNIDDDHDNDSISINT